MPALREYYMRSVTFAAAGSAEVGGDAPFSVHVWDVSCRWTAGSGASLAVRSRPIAGTTGADIPEHAFAQADGDASILVESTADALVVVLSGGTDPQCVVRCVGVPAYDAARGQQTFVAVTPS